MASYIFEPDVAAFTEDLIETSVKEDDFDMNEYKINENNPILNKNYFDVFVELNDYILIISSNDAQQKIEADFGIKEEVIN